MNNEQTKYSRYVFSFYKLAKNNCYVPTSIHDSKSTIIPWLY